MEHAITTPDGRTLAVQEAGDPAGKPVLVHGGTPNSRPGRNTSVSGRRCER